MFDKLKAKIDAKKAKKEGERLDREREEKCMPVAKFILSLILEADLTLGEKSDEEYAKDHFDVVVKIMDRFLEVDLKLSDVSYVKQIMQEMVDNVNNSLTRSINNSLRIGEKDYWGMDKDEATFGMLDKKLKSWAEKEKVKKLDK